MGHVKEVGQGSYVAYDGYFAVRDNHTSQWRLSTVTATGNGEMLFAFVREFTHLSEVEQYITDQGW